VRHGRIDHQRDVDPDAGELAGKVNAFPLRT